MNIESAVILVVIGFITGVLFTAGNIRGMILSRVRGETLKRAAPYAIAALVCAAFLFHGIHPALADTPVPLEIPTNEIFTQTNNWMATFAPIVAIGVGISVALAILGYLGKMIVGAFKH